MPRLCLQVSRSTKRHPSRTGSYLLSTAGAGHSLTIQSQFHPGVALHALLPVAQVEGGTLLNHLSLFCRQPEVSCFWRPPSPAWFFPGAVLLIHDILLQRASSLTLDAESCKLTAESSMWATWKIRVHALGRCPQQGACTRLGMRLWRCPTLCSPPSA